MSFSVTAFKSAINEGSRPNLYKITVTSPATSISQDVLNNFNFLCRSASLPGSTSGLIEIPMIAGRRLKRIGDRTFAEWTSTVLNDESFLIRKALEDWQSSIVTANYNNDFIGNRTFNGTSDFYSTVLVQQLNSSGNVVENGSYTLVNCWPSDIAAIDLSYDTTDSIEEFTVTWTYDYYTVAGVTE